MCLIIFPHLGELIPDHIMVLFLEPHQFLPSLSRLSQSSPYPVISLEQRVRCTSNVTCGPYVRVTVLFRPLMPLISCLGFEGVVVAEFL